MMCSKKNIQVLMVHGWLDNCHSFVHMGPAVGLFRDNLKIPFKHQNVDYMLSWQTLDSMQLLWTYQVCPNEHNHCQHP